MKETHKIPSGSYIGYFRMSDAAGPVAFIDSDTKVSDFINEKLAHPTANPFVIEARLFDPESRRSISIMYADGEYLVNEYKVAETVADVRSKKYDHITLKKYIAHRIPGKKLLFFQYWKEQPDLLCESMPVLNPAELVFVGFETIKTDAL